MGTSIIHQILTHPAGGTGRSGDSNLPQYGYYVGGAGPALVFPSPERVDHYLLAQFVLFTMGDELVGWWTDEETGKMWIDRTTWHDNLAEARETAVKRGEIAFYSIAEERSIRS